MKTLKDILKLMDKKSKTNDFKNCKASDFTKQENKVEPINDNK